MGENQEKKLHIAMYPWFGYGHMTPFLNLANKLAQRGHKISFFLPTKAHPKLASHNHHPNLITFIPVQVPAVNGLPDGSETTADTPSSYKAQLLLSKAMDLTRPTIDCYLSHLQPNVVFFDYAHWVPGLARKYRAKSIFFCTTFVSFLAYMSPSARGISPVGPTKISDAELRRAPPGFPSRASLGHGPFEARQVASGFDVPVEVVGDGLMSLPEKAYRGIGESDGVCCRSCREMEGQYGKYFEEHYGKPMLWAGPVRPELLGSNNGLDEELDGWLNCYEAGRVVYCALGSECALGKELFQELLLGIELTGLPFMACLKPPMDCETVESAIPEGFLERTKERGIIYNGWVPQQLILKHNSIGCFVTHCGAGSLWEALVSKCQLVLLPESGDQFFNAKFMSKELRVGVEVEKGEEDGLFTKEAICKAITMVMEVEIEVGKEIRANHAKWREVLLREGLEEFYINEFVKHLQDLIVG